jgi:DNA invertase Pin-like site-specific DNA recombinase
VNQVSDYEFLVNSYQQQAGNGNEEQTMQDGKSRLIQAIHAVRDEIYVAVREQLADDTKTYQQIADAAGCSVATVQRIAGSLGISRPVGPRPQSPISEATNGNN